MKNWLAILLVSTSAFGAGEALTRLIVFGGGTLPDSGIQRLVELSGGKSSRILFIPWASSFPEASFDYFKGLAEKYHPKEIVLTNNYAEVKKDPRTFIASLSQYSAIFFSGGDQNSVMNHLEESHEIQAAFLSEFKKGKVFSGTSAGLAMMSSTMLTGNADMGELDPKAVETRRGLGLLDGAVLDQHFIRRNRMQRLLSVMLGSTERYGIGVDENTGILVESGRDVEVIGERKVVVIDKGEMAGKLTLEVQKPGDRFRLADYRRSDPMETR